MPQLDEVGHTLLNAASALLASEGPAALTVRRIAAEAGMSTMNVYSRFGSKEGVVEHLYVEGFQLLGRALQAVRTTNDPVADLMGCGRAYRMFAHENATLYTIMFDRAVPDFEPSPDAAISALNTLNILGSRLQKAMDAGLLTVADPLLTAAIVWSTCHGAVSLELKHVGPEVLDWDDVYSGVTEAVVRGLAAVPAR